MKFTQAFKNSPGPDTWPQALVLWIKGFGMGTADIIPGVSGGTIALITGIYHRLIAAINSFDLSFARRVFTGKFSEALAGVHLRFLLPLLLGIAMAIVLTSRVIHYLLLNHAVEVWSLFFGLIAASMLVVGRQVGRLTPATILVWALFTVIAFVVVGIIPVQTPDALWFIFICGAVAICAMILPGISGAFILLILGKYALLTGALKDPFNPTNLLLIAVFMAGALVGILSFSRLLNFLLARFQDLTMAALAGFMLGAMRKVWPWKEVLETQMIRGKEHVLTEANVLPEAMDEQFWLAVGLMILGAVLVLIIDRVGRRGQPERGAA